jgi:predicted nucleic acid-binding protein
MFDTNVLLDIFEKRSGHSETASVCVNRVLAGVLEGFVPAHTVTTLAYFFERPTSSITPHSGVAWIVDHFSVSACDAEILRCALQSQVTDFEDAVVEQCALRSQCDYILTRNLRDFSKSTVPAILPATFRTTHIG